MKEIKTDLRYIKTKEEIHRAFRLLLKTMPYEKITVKLLTEKARINRKTFYLHYDMLDELLDEISCEIISMGMDAIRSYTIPGDLRNIISATYQYWQSLTEDDAMIFRLSSASLNGMTFTRQMRDTFVNFDAGFCGGNLRKQKTSVAFIVGTIGTVYQEWTVYHACPSLKEAVELAYRLITAGIGSAGKSE